MKRSTVNTIMAEAGEMIRRHGFALPPFAYWSPEQFKARADKARHVIDARCGWDITDYGAGRFHEMGLFLDRKSTRLNSSHSQQSRMPSSA